MHSEFWFFFGVVSLLPVLTVVILHGVGEVQHSVTRASWRPLVRKKLYRADSSKGPVVEEGKESGTDSRAQIRKLRRETNEYSTDSRT